MSQTSAARAAEEFSAVYREHYWTIVTFFRRRGDPDPVARDLTAEVFTVAWRRRSEEEATLPWLYGIARMTHLAHVRSEGRRRRLMDRLRHDQQPTSGGGHDQVEQIVLVRDALRRLPQPDQEVLMLTEWEGLTAAEIGVVVGCSANAAAVRLHRARRRLRTLLFTGPVSVTTNDMIEVIPT